MQIVRHGRVGHGIDQVKAVVQRRSLTFDMLCCSAAPEYTLCAWPVCQMAGESLSDLFRCTHSLYHKVFMVVQQLQRKDRPAIAIDVVPAGECNTGSMTSTCTTSIWASQAVSICASHSTPVIVTAVHVNRINGYPWMRLALHHTEMLHL